MAKKKKKNIVRCDVCGVAAVKHIAGDVHVCANPVCEIIAREEIEAVVAFEKYVQQEEKGE